MSPHRTRAYRRWSWDGWERLRPNRLHRRAGRKRNLPYSRVGQRGPADRPDRLVRMLILVWRWWRARARAGRCTSRSFSILFSYTVYLSQAFVCEFFAKLCRQPDAGGISRQRWMLEMAAAAGTFPARLATSKDYLDEMANCFEVGTPNEGKDSRFLSCRAEQGRRPGAGVETS